MSRERASISFNKSLQQLKENLFKHKKYYQHIGYYMIDRFLQPQIQTPTDNSLLFSIEITDQTIPFQIKDEQMIINESQAMDTFDLTDKIIREGIIANNLSTTAMDDQLLLTILDNPKYPFLTLIQKEDGLHPVLQILETDRNSREKLGRNKLPIGEEFEQLTTLLTKVINNGRNAVK